MSTSGTATVERARDLQLPGQAERVEEVFQWLSPEGAQRFSWEVLTAVVTAKRTNDLHPVAHVIESWCRTPLFMRDPAFRKAAENAIGDPGSPDETMTVAQAQEALGL